MLKKIISNPVLRNFSILTSSNLLVQALSIFSSIKIAKGLKPDLYGNYSYIISLSSIYLVISSLGFRNNIIRNVAVGRHSESIFLESFVARSLMFLVSCFLILSYNYFYSSIRFDIPILLLLMFHVFTCLHWDTFESISFGFERMKFSAIINVSFTLLFVVSITLLPFDKISVINILSLTVATQFLKTLTYAFISKRQGILKSSRSLKLTHLYSRIRESLPYYLLAIFTLFTSQVPILYLEHFSSPMEIGYFNVSNRIILPFQMLLLTLLSSLFPNLSKAYEYDKPKFQKTVKWAFLVIFFVGILGALVVSSFRREVIIIMYGPSYSKSADVIAMQCWFTVLFAIFCLIGTILGAINRQKLIAKLSVAYALISMPCLFFGAKYGAVGLSIGFIVMALINMTYHIYWLRRSMGNFISLKYYLGGFVFFLITFFVSFKLAELSLVVRISLYFLLVISLFLYYKLKLQKQPLKPIEDARN